MVRGGKSGVSVCVCERERERKNAGKARKRNGGADERRRGIALVRSLSAM